ncbi:hypothetical protein Hanom_Chr08g00744711 [Helianthus anomalus]
MVPIKCNQLLNQYPPLDLAEIKSQPLKLPKIIAVVVEVQSSSLRFPSSGGYLHLSLPIISTTTQPPSVRRRFS